MRLKKKTAWLLSFVMVIVAVMSGKTLSVRADNVNVSFQLSISVAEGTTAPGNYRVDYQVVDSEGIPVKGGAAGSISSAEAEPVQLNSIDDSYWIQFTVRSAGLSIRLNGDDVTNQGWNEGNKVPVREVNEKEYRFELFQSNNGNGEPGGGNGQPQGGTYEISFTDGTVSGNTVSYTVGDATVTLTSSVAISGNKVTVGENDEFTLSDNFNQETMEVVVYALDGFSTTLNVIDGKTSIANKTNEGGIPDSVFLKIQEKNGGGDPNPPEGPENEFDGIAYFVWQGENDALCVHKITGLEASRSQGEVIAFDIIYIPVSTVKDDSTGEAFVIGNENYYWLWSSAEGFIQDHNASYRVFDTAVQNITDYEEKRSTLIDPCGAENGKSTVCTNGDRNFRATIYDDTAFEGVAFSQREADYTYFPGFWDNVFFTNTVDISGSTAENPAIYESFLLEPTIHFGMAANSVNAFTGIRALNVPDGAVTITGDAANGYDIEFGSNFFDHVVFEITTDGGNYYLELVRTAIQAFDTNGPGVADPMIVAEVYYDNNESYQDYEVYANIHYKDGSVSMQKMNVSEITDDGFGNTMPAGTYEMDAGKGLKCAQYRVAAAEDIVGVDFNAIKSGSLSETTYGGSYFGSENGVYFDIETRRLIY